MRLWHTSSVLLQLCESQWSIFKTSILVSLISLAKNIKLVIKCLLHWTESKKLWLVDWINTVLPFDIKSYKKRQRGRKDECGDTLSGERRETIPKWARSDCQGSEPLMGVTNERPVSAARDQSEARDCHRSDCVIRSIHHTDTTPWDGNI